MRRIIIAAAVSLAALAPGAASAQDSVVLELVDHVGSGPPETVRVEVPIDARGGSRFVTQVGSVRYEVSIARDGQSRTLVFEVARVDGQRNDRNMEIRVSAALRNARPVTLARLRRTDGSVTEVTARLAHP